MTDSSALSVRVSDPVSEQLPAGLIHSVPVINPAFSYGQEEPRVTWLEGFGYH